MPTKPAGDYEKNVFINCPFDKDYLSLLRPLLFTIVSFGFKPKIALENSDSGELRLNKICQLIEISKYSIHDLSRLQASAKNEFYRLNMPFELGIDYGCRRFSSAHHKQKRCLILEKGRFDFAKAISDLSGVDIKSHNNEPQALVRAVRDWFVETVKVKKASSPTIIWYRFNEFAAEFYVKRKNEGFRDDDVNMMPVPEYIDFIQKWLRANPKTKP
mgnify:CR=1 FL=1